MFVAAYVKTSAGDRWRYSKYGKNLILSPIFSCPQFACSNVLQTFKTRSPRPHPSVTFLLKSLLISLPLCQLSHYYLCRGIKKHKFLMLAPPLVTCQHAVIVQSIGTEVCVHRWCSAQHLSSPCNREESNQPLTAPASSICSEAEERGSHQSQKRSSWETDQHPDLCQNLTLSLTDTPWATNTASCTVPESPPDRKSVV